MQSQAHGSIAACVVSEEAVLSDVGERDDRSVEMLVRFVELEGDGGDIPEVRRQRVSVKLGALDVLVGADERVIVPGELVAHSRQEHRDREQSSEDEDNRLGPTKSHPKDGSRWSPWTRIFSNRELLRAGSIRATTGERSAARAAPLLETSA